MKRAVALLLVVTMQVAYAAPHQVMVMRAEGNADAASRTNIDSHVIRLAKNIDGKVEAADITLTDAAAAVGCNPSEAACKDDVLATLGVDEIVATTATSTPTGITVTVRRITKGSGRTAQTVMQPGKSNDAKLNADLGPLFGLAAAPVAKPADKPTVKATDKPSEKATEKPADKPVDNTAPAPLGAAPTTTADASTTPIHEDTVTAAPAGQVTPEGAPPNRRLQKIGMGVGGAFVVLSFVLWSQANRKQDEIDAAPLKTPADFAHVQSLEDEGDGLAGGGNLFFIGGILIGGISGYFYWRKGRSASSQQARVTPTVYPGGAGVTLTIGGLR